MAKILLIKLSLATTLLKNTAFIRFCATAQPKWCSLAEFSKFNCC